jgi:high-affinity iron transporter
VRNRYGANAVLVQNYLRAHPQALAGGQPDPIRLAREKLEHSSGGLRSGEHAAALETAISAYLDGFELAGRGWTASIGLRVDIEREMMSLRGELGQGASPEAVRTRAQHIDLLLARAQEKISGEGLSQASAFVSACVILLREGLEAILLLAAIIAFVAKTGRREAMPWVHAGWMAALVLGMLTWFAAEFLIDISGANREVTEGTTALIAAGMLLYVGFWLHGKSQSKAWSRFLHQQVGAALEKRTVWAMASVSFLAVYRELFEIVLFYQALWAQSGSGVHGAVLGGIGASVVILAIAGWGIFTYGVRLPLGPFSTSCRGWFSIRVRAAGDGIALQAPR